MRALRGLHRTGARAIAAGRRRLSPPAIDARAARRLDEVAGRWGLDGAATGRLAHLLALIANDPTAPTTVRDPAAAVDAHVADALVGLDVPGVRDATTIADLGAGAGFPGLVLAVALPEARVDLVESVGRKADFLRRAVAGAEIGNATVVAERVEDWEQGRARCDLACARALAALPVVLEYAAPLLRPGGRLVAWRGARLPEEEQEGAVAAGLLGLELSEVRRVEPFPQARDRHLHVYVKARPTPSRFPRRTGVARKRPLGAA